MPALSQRNPRNPNPLRWPFRATGPRQPSANGPLGPKLETLTEDFSGALTNPPWAAQGGALSGGGWVQTGANQVLESTYGWGIRESYFCAQVSDDSLSAGDYLMRVWQAASPNFTNYVQFFSIRASSQWQMLENGGGGTTTTTPITPWIAIRESGGVFYWYTAATQPTGPPLGTQVGTADASGWTCQKAQVRGYTGVERCAARLGTNASTVGAVTWDNVNTFGAAQTVVPVGQASEADTAQPILPVKMRAVGQTSELDTAQPLARVKIRLVGQAVETDTAQPVARLKTRTVGQASETDTAQPITRGATTITRAVGPASETDTAQPVGRLKTRAVGQASELDTAQPITRRKVRTVGQASELDTAQPITRRKTKAVGQASTTDTAQPVTRRKTRALGQAATTDTAQPITRRKIRLVGQAVETDTAQPITQLGAAAAPSWVARLGYQTGGTVRACTPGGRVLAGSMGGSIVPAPAVSGRVLPGAFGGRVLNGSTGGTLTKNAQTGGRVLAGRAG